MGHKGLSSAKALQLFLDKPHWRFRYNHGGVLRQKRRGRKARPLSTRDPIHIVFKADRRSIKRGFRSPLGFLITKEILKKYSKRFFVKIEQAAICQDHIHLIIRLSKRSLGQHFLRVVAGQIAQQFQNKGMLVTDTQELSQSGKESVTGTQKSFGGEQRAAVGGLKKLSGSGQKSVTDTQSHSRQGHGANATTTRRLWKYWPFTRVVKSFRAFKTLQSYVRLNHLESIKKISYRKKRLRGMLPHEYGVLWS